MTVCQGPSGPFVLPGNEPCPGGYSPGIITPGGYLPGYILNNLNPFNSNAQGQSGLQSAGATVERGYGGAVNNAIQNQVSGLLPTGLANWLSNSGNWAHLGLLVAGAVLVVVGILAFTHTDEHVTVSTTTGTAT